MQCCHVIVYTGSMHWHHQHQHQPPLYPHHSRRPTMPQALVQCSEAGEEAEAALRAELEALWERRTELQQQASALSGEVQELQEQGAPLAAGEELCAGAAVGLVRWAASKA